MQGKQENASTCSSPRGSSTNRKPRPDNVLLSKCVCDRLCSDFDLTAQTCPFRRADGKLRNLQKYGNGASDIKLIL